MSTEAIIKSGKVLPFIFRHPWVFKGALEKVNGEFLDGQVLKVVGPKRDFIAWGWINYRSKLVIRLISFDEDFKEERWLRKRIQKAIELRKDFLSCSERTNAYRLIHSEGDGIPGLIIDRYGEHLIVQISCLALERLEHIIVDEIFKLEGVKGVTRRDDPVMTRMEGMEPKDKTLKGEDLPDEFLLNENDLKYKVIFDKSQKTGFYLDHRNNRRKICKYTEGVERALDAFCYTGGFSLNLSKYGGVDEIIAIDSSDDCLSQLKHNAQLNDCNNIETLQGNVFHVLEEFNQKGEEFDLIIVDPPKFIPNKRSFDKGFSGYKKLNRRAFRLLPDNGLLLSCCCSQMMDDSSFMRMLAEAAGEAGREAIVIDKTYQPPDHPVAIACPEGSYLKSYLLRVR